MQITRITVHRYDVPLEEPFVTALRPVPELERVLVEVETDDGIVGYGEGAPGPKVTGETQTSVASAIETQLGPRVLGADPLSIERFCERLDSTLAEAPTAKAALEIAAHDIRGKAADQPLYKVLGGYADEPTLEAPAVLSLKAPSEMAADAAEAVEAGYRQLKIKLGEEPDLDVDRVTAIQQSVPHEVSLKVDANQGWHDAKTALRALRPIEGAVDVVEQPVDEERIDDLVFLREALDVPIMPDESLWNADDALELVRRGAGDVYNIKLMKTGGILEADQINAIAETAGRSTQIGSMVEGHVGTAAGVHFALAHENVIWNEMVGPFMADDGITDLKFETPRIVADGPGLGVEIDRDTLSRLRVERGEVADR